MPYFKLVIILALTLFFSFSVAQSKSVTPHPFLQYSKSEWGLRSPSYFHDQDSTIDVYSSICILNTPAPYACSLYTITIKDTIFLLIISYKNSGLRTYGGTMVNDQKYGLLTTAKIAGLSKGKKYRLSFYCDRSIRIISHNKAKSYNKALNHLKVWPYSKIPIEQDDVYYDTSFVH
jgi:hypothetical protein